ncbi:MAG TPA: metallophosphoesterase [Pyrinomonadaceae bacterium]|nr:metallophosphoesterase [Pyrinomonadaceae bacterium]
MKRTLVVGDIHGCFEELLSLMEKAALGPEDRLIAVGDLITKGPRNREVLELFANDQRLSSVIGNQDLAVLRSLRGEDVSLTAAQERTARELKSNATPFRMYLESLPGYIELNSHIIVHAGLRPGVPLHEQSIEDLTELRTMGADRTSREGLPWFEVYDGEKMVLFGHWPGPEPKIARRAIGLDTGCVYGHLLTAYIIETNEFLSVGASPHRFLPVPC